MPIVVTTPTGNIGKALTGALLEKGETPTIIARRKETVAHFAERGAVVIEGSHGDSRTLMEATRGADALFVLVPPDLASNDIRAHYRRFGAAAADAVRANEIPHVVLLSSVGAELEGGNGPIVGLHDVEGMLSDVSTHLACLRPGYFMENTLWQIGAIQGTNSLYTTFNGDTSIPMIATRDIAAKAAELLIDRRWSGNGVVELQGPADVSYNRVAAILTGTLGRSVQHVRVSPEQFKKSMLGMGASEHIADLFNEMGAGMDAGKIRFHEPRNEKTATPTTYETFSREVFKGAFEAASAAA